MCNRHCSIVEETPGPTLRRLKEEQKFFPVCLQDLSCGHQSLSRQMGTGHPKTGLSIKPWHHGPLLPRKLEDASSCESLSWKDGDDVSIYLTRSSVDIEKCLPILWSAESRSKAAALEFHEIETFGGASRRGGKGKLKCGQFYFLLVLKWMCLKMVDTCGYLPEWASNA